jgi:xylulokinase
MLVGVDIGTQGLKAAVTDPELGVRGQARRSYRPHFPRAGWAEQDPRIWESALGPAIAEALKQAGARSSAVTAIGICGQLDGCIPVGRTGEPQSNCIIWMDRRAEAEMADIPADVVHGRTGIVPDPGHMAAKIRWLKRHSPDAREIARYHQPVSYIVEQLTGEAVLDHALASTTMLYDLDARRYDDDLLAAFDVVPGELPRIAEASDRAGALTRRGAELTGLPAGTPVAVGTGDDFSTPLGAGVISPGKVTVAIGTGEVVGGLVDEPMIDGSRLVETHAYPAGGYFIENPGWLSGGAVTWLRDLLGLTSFAELDALAAQSPPGAEGVLFLPALTGAMAPQWIAGARGCFFGLTPAHGPRDLARSLLEGTGFAMRDVIETLCHLGIGAEGLTLLAGGSRSRLAAQIRADISRLPVSLPEHADSAVIGAAMLAGVAGGPFKSIAEAASRASPPREIIHPSPSASAALDESYRRYRQLFEALKPVFNG